MARHDDKAAAWANGQYWEVLNDGCEYWVPVGNGGKARPLWCEHADYRRRPDLEVKDCNDAEARRLWIEAGMPPYLLSKPGTNHGIVRLIELARATAKQTTEES